MKLKRLSMICACMALVVSLLPTPALALGMGAYTGSVVTSYYNPDTGNVDDGGTSNAELGEGMCRSATHTRGLVEVDKNGNTWVTIRLLLASNCKNAAFYTRTGYNSYSRASHEITSENSASDSIDYRFRVPSAGTNIKATMYVTPMGRDVTWYLHVDPSSLSAGAGDFVVCIDTSKPAPPPKKPAAQTKKHEKDKDDDKDKDKKDKDKDKDEKDKDEKDKDKDKDKKDKDKDKDKKDKDKDEKDEDLTEDEAEEAEDEAAGGSGMSTAIVAIVVIIAVILAVIGIKRRRK